MHFILLKKSKQNKVKTLVANLQEISVKYLNQSLEEEMCLYIKEQETKV